MKIQDLSNSSAFRLSRVLRILESRYNITIDFAAAHAGELHALRQHFAGLRQQIVQESQHNIYHQNPEYAKASLIEEAIGIFLREVAPKRRRRKNSHA